ncbi:MAG: tripartite tricarboxylate transporter substrate binding protein [Sulfurospirillaceae bacterium]|nr:tripartite tricarboxylate transporter substrate binding protein [Sulfurospirillaceae bacterium]
MIKILFFLSYITSLLFTPNLFSTNLFASEDYPKQPINLIVGFGVGGSSDRLARAMAPFLSKDLNTPIVIMNKVGEGSKIAASYVLKQPADGYTIFATTFTPYLANTILMEGATYHIEDFDYINIQWYDNDIVAVNNESPFHSLTELLELIKNGETKIKVAVMENSSGHLLLKFLLKSYAIPDENIELHLFNSGKKARDAIIQKEIDMIIISSEGSELIREHLRTLAVFSEERHPKWDVPTVNEAVLPLGFQVPFFIGSMRGFAVSAKLKRDYPKRYAKIVQSLIKILARKEVQRILRTEKIGGVWTGPKKSNALVKDTFLMYQQNAHLLRK